MEIAMSILYLLGGIAVFMYGMKTMSQGLEQVSGPGLKRLFRKISVNSAVDYGVGIGFTSLTMSSSATSIMTIGLTNANIIDQKQGSGIILGAKVGTTLTAFLFAMFGLSRGGFSVSAVFSSFAIVGMIILIASKNEKLRSLARFLVGFGMLFIGMQVMQGAIGGADSPLSSGMQNLFRFQIMQNPFFLIVIAIFLTAAVQSSSATIGIFITLLLTGVITNVDQVFFLVLGANIGTCDDALIASIGANRNAKRVAWYHVLSAVFGAIVFGTILAVLRTPIMNMFENMFPGVPAFSVATFNLLYNLLYTLILLPFLPLQMKWLRWLIKDKEEKTNSLIDDRLLANFTIAFKTTMDEVTSLANLSLDNVNLAYQAIVNNSLENVKQIDTNEDEIDKRTKLLAAFLIKLSSICTSKDDEVLVGRLHHVANDIERIGDHAINISEQATFLYKNEVKFSTNCLKDLNEAYDAVNLMLKLAIETFSTRQITNLKEVANISEKVEKLLTRCSDMHVERLNLEECSILASRPLYTVIHSLQRIADHSINIAFSIVSNTGSKTEGLQLISGSLAPNDI